MIDQRTSAWYLSREKWEGIYWGTSDNSSGRACIADRLIIDIEKTSDFTVSCKGVCVSWEMGLGEFIVRVLRIARPRLSPWFTHDYLVDRALVYRAGCGPIFPNMIGREMEISNTNRSPARSRYRFYCTIFVARLNTKTKVDRKWYCRENKLYGKPYTDSLSYKTPLLYSPRDVWIYYNK